MDITEKMELMFNHILEQHRTPQKQITSRQRGTSIHILENQVGLNLTILIIRFITAPTLITQKLMQTMMK